MPLFLRKKIYADDIRFFHYYRITAYPFNPILADIDRFESDLCMYLNAYSAGELRDKDKITNRWATDRAIGHISLLLATLAAGAHYSDIDHPQRLELTIDFGELSSQYIYISFFITLTYLHSATIISRPSPIELPFPTITRHYPSAFDPR